VSLRVRRLLGAQFVHPLKLYIRFLLEPVPLLGGLHQIPLAGRLDSRILRDSRPQLLCRTKQARGPQLVSLDLFALLFTLPRTRIRIRLQLHRPHLPSPYILSPIAMELMILHP